MVGQLWDNEALGKLDLEWLIINTDVQELSCTFMPDQDKLLIGASATKWAGAQGNHLMGQAAAEESTEDISKALEGADLVLLLAGMGGGTGRGAAPVVADVARQQGTCTISIAMVPEQPTSQPMLLALAGLQAAADAAVAVRCTGGSTNGSGADAHQLPVTCLVQGIADLLLGYDPADLDEVQAAVADGLSTLGFAVAQGYDSLTRAVFAAMSNRECLPILQQASGVLCFVAGSEDIPDSWVTDVQEVLSSQCSSAHTVLVRAVQSDLPPGTTAATVLITTPAHSMLKEVASEEESAANQSADASAPKPLAENGTVRHLADVADAVNGDAPNAAGDEEQQQQQHD